MKRPFQSVAGSFFSVCLLSASTAALAEDGCSYRGDHLICGSGTIGSTYFTTAVGLQNRVTGQVATAVGSNNEASDYSAAIGAFNRAGRQSSAIGIDNRALSGIQSVATGTENWVYGNNSSAFGFRNLIGDVTAPVNNGVAIGVYNQLNADRSIMIGTSNINNSNNVGSIIIGNNSTIGIRDFKNYRAEYVIAIGEKVNVIGARGVAVGIESTVTGNMSVAIGSNAYAKGDSSVAIGAESYDGGQRMVVSVGSEGNERRVINVASGINPTDAVNMSQLSSVQDGLRTQMNAVGQKAYYGVATVAAVAGIPALQANQAFNLGLGLGNYQGQTAVALGGQLRVNSNLVVKAAFGFGNQGTTSSVGVGVAF